MIALFPLVTRKAEADVLHVAAGRRKLGMMNAAVGWRAWVAVPIRVEPGHTATRWRTLPDRLREIRVAFFEDLRFEALLSKDPSARAQGYATTLGL